MASNSKWQQRAAASIKRRGTKGKCGGGCNRPGCTGSAKGLCCTWNAQAGQHPAACKKSGSKRSTSRRRRK